MDVGRYPLFVLAGLVATGLLSARGFVQRWRQARIAPVDPAVTTGGAGALALIAGAAVLDLILLDSAGFVLASTLLFWLTARAFDASRPRRDLAAALVLSVAAYLLFDRLLQLSLPPGILAGRL
jgi:putative tricarboxylic transport membrane protein